MDETQSTYHETEMTTPGYGYETYLSPLTWRYGSDEMRIIWSEAEKRRLLRRFWVALAEAQHTAGLVTAEQVADLRAHQDDIDIARSQEIEQEIRHDLMAEIMTYAEQCPVGGSIIHLGATSMDVLDNVDALRLRRALDVTIEKLTVILDHFAQRMEAEADTPAIAFTHIQPAEPTTVGYRLAQYAQDLLIDWVELTRVRDMVKGKGLKGAVGTSASYTQLLHESLTNDPLLGQSAQGAGADASSAASLTAQQLEKLVMDNLGLESFSVATQTYPRKQDWLILNALAGLSSSLHKFAFDIRILQSPPIGEWSEPFGLKQVGSSAMPFKRNPVTAENVNSLTRMVAAFPRVAWDNAALSLLERTLDDSANRRFTLPQAFLITDEVLKRANSLISGLQVWSGPTARNLKDYGVFAATERVLMEAVKGGANRQELHEVIRELSMIAWKALQEGKPNPLVDLMTNDPRIHSFVDVDEIPIMMDATEHVGDAPLRTRQLVEEIRSVING